MVEIYPKNKIVKQTNAMLKQHKKQTKTKRTKTNKKQTNKNKNNRPRPATKINAMLKQHNKRTRTRTRKNKERWQATVVAGAYATVLL
jgi:hypothetical protein